jgi:DUF177 domain-containing protein
MTRSPFIVDVADLVGREAPPRHEHFDVAVDWGLELSRVHPDPPLVADLVLTSLPGGILARGTLHYVVDHTCRRCLAEYRQKVDLPIMGLFEDEPDEESYPIDGIHVDLEPFIRDEVLLALPMLPQCPDGCAEVVSTPETDLNTDFPERANSPFAVLRDLLPPGD